MCRHTQTHIQRNSCPTIRVWRHKLCVSLSLSLSLFSLVLSYRWSGGTHVGRLWWRKRLNKVVKGKKAETKPAVLLLWWERRTRNRWVQTGRSEWVSKCVSSVRCSVIEWVTVEKDGESTRDCCTHTHRKGVCVRELINWKETWVWLSSTPVCVCVHLNQFWVACVYTNVAITCEFPLSFPPLMFWTHTQTPPLALLCKIRLKLIRRKVFLKIDANVDSRVNNVATFCWARDSKISFLGQVWTVFVQNWTKCKWLKENSFGFAQLGKKCLTLDKWFDFLKFISDQVSAEIRKNELCHKVFVKNGRLEDAELVADCACRLSISADVCHETSVAIETRPSSIWREVFERNTSSLNWLIVSCLGWFSHFLVLQSENN